MCFRESRRRSPDLIGGIILDSSDHFPGSDSCGGGLPVCQIQRPPYLLAAEDSLHENRTTVSLFARGRCGQDFRCRRKRISSALVLRQRCNTHYTRGLQVIESYSEPLAEASGSRTHPRHQVPHNGFEARAQHRPRMASWAILSDDSEGYSATFTSCLPRFSPCSIRTNAFGAFSRPSITSSRDLILPSRSQLASCRSASS